MSKELGTRINALLAKKGISRQKIAADLNSTEATVSRYITGEREPNADFVGRIAQYLGVTTDYLILGIGDESGKDFVKVEDSSKKNTAKNVAVSFGIIAGLIALGVGLGILSDKEKKDLSNLLNDKGGK